jgi:RIO-like serine/threonine protein kinase
MEQLKIQGHSGCSLNIIEGPSHLLVEKCCDASYLPRLKQQQKKQSDMYSMMSHGAVGGIKVPHSTWENNKIVMDYIYSKDFVEFFECATVEDIRHLVYCLINYIDMECMHCERKIVDKDVFIKKLDSVYETCLKNDIVDNDKAKNYVDIAKDIVNSFNVIELPIGICHGDLTFSNVLFSDNIYLIDFLDSFVETPLQDIVKLRQDTRYHWSLLMTSHNYNGAHINTVFEYIDKELEKRYKNAYFYKYYDMLQCVNILRILPYIKEHSVYDRVCIILDKLTKK